MASTELMVDVVSTHRAEVSGFPQIYMSCGFKFPQNSYGSGFNHSSDGVGFQGFLMQI